MFQSGNYIFVFKQRTSFFLKKTIKWQNENNIITEEIAARRQEAFDFFEASIGFYTCAVRPLRGRINFSKEIVLSEGTGIEFKSEQTQSE